MRSDLSRIYLPQMDRFIQLAQQEDLVLQASQKLTLEQREEAFNLLDAGTSLRQVAKRFGVNPESLRRLVKRHKPA